MKRKQVVFQSHLPFGIEDMKGSLVLYTLTLAAITLLANMASMFLPFISFVVNSSYLVFILPQVGIVLLPFMVFGIAYVLSVRHQMVTRWSIPISGAVIGAIIGIELGWQMFGIYFAALDGPWSPFLTMWWSGAVTATIGGSFAGQYMRIKESRQND